MPISSSAKKRVRQNEKRRMRNKSVRSNVRTSVKTLRALVAGGNLDQARTQYSLTEKKLDQAVAKGILHKNTASRYKSRLALLINHAAGESK